MAKILISISIFLGLFLLPLNYENRNKIDSDNWKLVWLDDFEGNEWDTTVWSVMYRARDGGCRNYITSNPKCYSIKDGILKIRAIKNQYDLEDTASYLTGGLYTKFKKAFSPGRLEVKARFNGVPGKSCGIWMLPFINEKGWPADGEIDIMEHAGNYPYITQTLHSSYTKRGSFKGNPIRYVKEELDYTDFNTYGVVISEDCVDFYINDYKTLSYPKIDSLDSKGQFPFYRDWYLLLSTASRGPFDTICAPLEMEIDWVKYYKIK